MADEAAQQELKEENFPQVYVQRCRPRPIVRLVQRATHGNRPRTCPQTIHSWAQDETACAHEETAQSEERGTAKRETCRGEDPSSKYDRVAGHDRFHHRYPQREDVQSG